MHRSGNIQGSTTLWQERISIFLIMMMNISNSYYIMLNLSFARSALVSIRTHSSQSSLSNFQ
jgi:hypothetical protein